MALPPARPVRTPEPSPPLRAVLDLPLRATTISEQAAQRIRQLDEQVRNTAKDGDWTGVYDAAIKIAEGIADETEGRVAELQRLTLELEDPNEARQRIVEGPRREAERLRTGVSSAVQRVERDWTDRSKRQLDHVLEKCLESARKSVEFTETKTTEGLKLGLDATWWAQFQGYVGRCCDEWTRNVTTGFEQEATKAVAEGTTSLKARTGGRGVAAPPSQPAPATEARLGEEPPEKHAEVPSRGAALMRYVRSHVMAVSMFGTLFAVLIGVVFQLTAGDGSGTARPISTMYVRGGLLLLVLPVALIMGLRAGGKQREQLRAKALDQHREVVQGFLKTSVDRMLDRHRKALERWIRTRAEAWTAEVSSFWDVVLTPALADDSSTAAAAVRDLKLQQSNLAEQLNTLKTFRNQVQQNVLFELRRRRRELSEEAPEGRNGQ